MPYYPYFFYSKMSFTRKNQEIFSSLARIFEIDLIFIQEVHR